MHSYYFYLPVMNLGASVTISSVSVTISKVAAHRQGPNQYHSPTLDSDGSMAVFGFLINRYNIVEAEDLAWFTLIILWKWSWRPLFTRGFDTANLPRKKFATFNLSNWKSVCKWNWLMKEHYIAHSIACFEGPTTNILRFSNHFARSRPQNGYIRLQRWKG